MAVLAKLVNDVFSALLARINMNVVYSGTKCLRHM